MIEKVPVSLFTHNDAAGATDPEVTTVNPAKIRAWRSVIVAN